MMTTKKTLTVTLSILCVSIGLGLFGYRLYRPDHPISPEIGETVLDLEVEKVTWDTSYAHKLRNTLVTGTWKNCQMSLLLQTLFDEAGVRAERGSNEMPSLDLCAADASVDRMPLDKVISNMLGRAQGLKCIVFEGVIILKESDTSQVVPDDELVLDVKDAVMNISVVRVDPNSPPEYKLKNTLVTGTWKDCTVYTILSKLFLDAGIKPSYHPSSRMYIRAIAKEETVDRMPLDAVLFRILRKSNSVQCVVREDHDEVLIEGAHIQRRSRDGEWVIK
jgi:hypothetical protein